MRSIPQRLRAASARFDSPGMRVKSRCARSSTGDIASAVRAVRDAIGGRP